MRFKFKMMHQSQPWAKCASPSALHFCFVNTNQMLYVDVL